MPAPDPAADIDAIGWSIKQTARTLGCSENLLRRWLAGDADMPVSVITWLARLARAHARLQPPGPDEWRTRAPKRAGA